MADRKTTVHRSEHLRVDKFVSFIPMLVLIYIWTLITLPLLFQFAKTNEKVMLPPLYVLNFTSNPPLSCCHFLLCPPSNFPTSPPGSYCTVPKWELRIRLDEWVQTEYTTPNLFWRKYQVCGFSVSVFLRTWPHAVAKTFDLPSPGILRSNLMTNSLSAL